MEAQNIGTHSIIDSFVPNYHVLLQAVILIPYLVSKISFLVEFLISAL